MASFLIDDSMMRQGLNLKGCELLLFALIFSFSKKGLTMYESELSLSERLPYSREQIGKSLASLLSQGLVIRSKCSFVPWRWTHGQARSIRSATRRTVVRRTDHSARSCCNVRTCVQGLMR